MIELWKGIAGFETRYQVSNLGRIKSLPLSIPHHDGVRRVKEIIRQPKKKKEGYLEIGLSCNKINRFYYIHRLVADAFIANPEYKPCVNHINGDRTDNRSENLEWCTYQENINHGILMGSIDSRGEKSKNSKLKDEDIIFIRSSSLKRSELAKMFNVFSSTITKIKARKTWAHIQ